MPSVTPTLKTFDLFFPLMVGAFLFSEDKSEDDLYPQSLFIKY